MAAGKPASFYRSPSFRGRRSFTLDLNDPSFDAVFDYAVQTSPDRPVQEAVRELLLQALASDATDGAIRAARMAAYREARTQVWAEVHAMFKGLAERFLDPALVGEPPALVENWAPKTGTGP